jgi:hypothetical protein
VRAPGIDAQAGWPAEDPAGAAEIAAAPEQTP